MTLEETLQALGIKPTFGILRDLASAFRDVRYSFLHNDEFDSLLRSDSREANRVYWFEILERAHLGAATGLLRQQRWIEGAVAAGCAPNFLAFAACLRGFVESSADVWDGLNGVASTLCAQFREVQAAITGDLRDFYLCEEIEDRLIHFQFARKPSKAEAHLPVHEAKHVKDYLTGLQRDQTGPLHECYAELCAVTHPGAESLLWFTLGAVRATSDEYVLNNAPDDQAIKAFCEKFAGLPPWMVQQGINLPLVTLKALNVFGVPQLYTRVMNEIDLDAIVAWQKIKADIARAKASRAH